MSFGYEGIVYYLKFLEREQNKSDDEYEDDFELDDEEEYNDDFVSDDELKN